MGGFHFRGAIFSAVLSLFVLLSRGEPSLEGSVTLGSAVDILVYKNATGGYTLDASVTARSVYLGTIKLQSQDVELISVSDAGVKKLASLEVAPVELSTDSTNTVAESAFWIKCDTSTAFDLATVLTADGEKETLFVRGTFNVLSKRGSGWVGLSGLSYEIPLSADMCVPKESAFIGSVSVDFLPDLEGYSLKGGAK